MHISKPDVRLENFSVNEALKEYILQALPECPSEESALKPQLIRPGKIPEPDDASCYRIKKYEVEANIKWYYERIKLHFSISFEKLPLPA